MLIMGVIASVMANIICDVAKKIFIATKYTKTSEEKIKIGIKDYLEKNISNEFNSLLENNDFERFFKLPQISDMLNSYIIYIMNGNLSKKLAELNNTKIQSQRFICEDDILEYLLNCFFEFKGNTTTTFDKTELRNFFLHIFNLSNDFFLNNLGLESKIELFEVNMKLSHGFNILIDKLDKYSSMIESVLKYPLVMQDLNFDKLRTEYMGVLKAKHNKTLIYLLDDFDLDKFYIPPTLSVSKHKHKHKQIAKMYMCDLVNPWSSSFDLWTNIFIRENIIYITGGAGYGKSLFMKNIIINHDKLNITESLDHIVIYGEIKWFIKIDGTFKTMTEFLKECITNSTLKDVDNNFINYHLNTGRCILLLDALDEVPMEKRKDLHKTIVAYLKNLNPNNKVCLTSRDRGFIPVDEEIEYFNIEPLDADQIGQYVDKIIYLGKFNQQDKEPFMQQAKGLVEKRFLNSFLILSLLINIYKGERELPETKLELYQKCLEYIANKRERPITYDNFDWKLIAPLMKDNTFIELSLLCFPNNKEIKEDEILTKLTDIYKETFIDTATLEEAINEFLKFCSERTELFIPANLDNSFKFFHRSFFEYFYSKHMVIRYTDSDEIYNKLIDFDVDSEIFELILARLKQETQDRYISLVKYVFDKCKLEFTMRKSNLKAFNVLILFFQVIDETTFQNRFIDLIIDNSEFIVENINIVSNQEIILNTIFRTNKIEQVLAAYRQAAYSEVIYFFEALDIEKILFIFKRMNEECNANYVYMGHLLRDFFPLSKSSHFYTTVLLQQCHFIDTLKMILNTSIGTQNEISFGKIKKLAVYYDSLDKEQKNIFDGFFK